MSNRSEYKFKIEGMSCDHCASRVEKAALAVEGVQGAEVHLNEGILTVWGGEPEAVVAQVEKAGYKAVPIKG